MSVEPAVVIQPLTFPVDVRDEGGDRPQRERLAAIDIGSNSIHMIVVEAEPNGGYRVLGREREMVRLGKTALTAGALSQSAMGNGLEALIKMTTLARLKGADQVVAVATSAVREARNGREFLDLVKAQTGLTVQLLSGVDEGRLIHRAVLEVVDLGKGPAAVVDIGGGSTEWITSRGGEIERVVSLRLGSLRCAARLKGDPPSAGSVARLRSEVQQQIADAGIPRGPLARVVATSGTAVCLADLVDLFAERAWKEGAGALREVRTKELTQAVERLLALERREIAALPPVGGPRSDSLQAGAILLTELLAHAGVERFSVCDRALREGLVLEALGQPVPLGQRPEELRRRQVLQLAQKAESVFRHNQQTARLAMRLFDLTTSIHKLGSREREWLEYAALLHDVGYSIHYRNHHKHAYYLIANATLDAFDPREIEIVAHVARYHRGSPPKPHHPTLRTLKPWQQKTISRLAALLRVADALDRTHASRVEELYAAIRSDRVKIEVMSRYAVDLELEAARLHGRFFEKIFGCKLALRQGLEAAV